jgi:hypothetical protein
VTVVEPACTHRVVRMVGAAVLAGHGLVHLMGVALLWRWGRPGGLRYEDVHPAAGSAAGLVVGGPWLGVAALFVASGVLLVARWRLWRGVALAAAVLSLAVLVPSASVVVAGIAVDVVVIVVVAGLCLRTVRR